MPAPRCFLWSALSIFLVWFLGFSPVAEVRCSGSTSVCGSVSGRGAEPSAQALGTVSPPAVARSLLLLGLRFVLRRLGTRAVAPSRGGCVLACRPHPRTRGCTLRLSAMAPARPRSFPPPLQAALRMTGSQRGPPQALCPSLSPVSREPLSSPYICTAPTSPLKPRTNGAWGTADGKFNS